MIEETAGRSFCNVCSHEWPMRTMPPRRFTSLDDLVARTGLRRDEVVTLADIGALNSFGYDRRSALWQAERAVRAAGELFRDEDPPSPLRRLRRGRLSIALLGGSRAPSLELEPRVSRPASPLRVLEPVP